MEIEAKFAVPSIAALERLETVPDLAGYGLDAGERRHDRDTFLDTADRRFLASGYYLRRRETSGGVRLTLKQIVTHASGVLRREELEARVAADAPPEEWQPGELRERVLAISGDATPEPFLRLSQERLARRVFDGGREVAELSLDRVLLDGAGEHRWFEAEIELRPDGTEDDLSRLTAALRRMSPLRPEARSKFARALEVMEAESAGASRHGLFPSGERTLHEDEARASGARGRRAQALLALDDGLTQVEAGRRAGILDGVYATGWRAIVARAWRSTVSWGGRHHRCPGRLIRTRQPGRTPAWRPTLFRRPTTGLQKIPRRPKQRARDAPTSSRQTP